jgi:hypothetical protein
MSSKNGKLQNADNQNADNQNADNQNADNQNADLIEDVLKGEVEHSRKKVKGLLGVGRSCLENSTDLDEATQYYEDGIRYWHCNELGEAYCSFDLAEHALMKALKNAGIIRRIFFGTITHSYVPIVISLIFFIIFSYLLLYHIEGIKPTPTLIGVPLWAALSGGLGGCAGVLYGVVWDQDYYGVVRYPWQLWFSVLPIFALTSGYLVYILIDTGIVALGGNPTGLGGNTTALEQPRLSLPGLETKALFCFLAGFWTYNIIDKLKVLLDNVLIFKK